MITIKVLVIYAEDRRYKLQDLVLRREEFSL